MNKSLDMNSVNCGLLCIVLVVVVLCCMNTTKTTENFRESRYCRGNCNSDSKCRMNWRCFICKNRCNGYKAAALSAGSHGNKQNCKDTCTKNYKTTISA